MTIDAERLRAINHARDLLEEMTRSKSRFARYWRKRIFSALHHYPEEWWVEVLKENFEKQITIKINRISRKFRKDNFGRVG